MCSLEQWGSKIRTWEVRLEYEKRIREGRDSHHLGKSFIEIQTNIVKLQVQSKVNLKILFK